MVKDIEDQEEAGEIFTNQFLELIRGTIGLAHPNQERLKAVLGVTIDHEASQRTICVVGGVEEAMSRVDGDVDGRTQQVG